MNIPLLIVLVTLLIWQLWHEYLHKQELHFIGFLMKLEKERHDNESEQLKKRLADLLRK